MAGGANNVVWTGISTLLMYFYTDVVSVAAGLIGTIFLFSRLVDGASDAVMGVVLDKTRTCFGKARPWLLWMALPVAVVATALFAVTAASATVQIVYIIITTQAPLPSQRAAPSTFQCHTSFATTLMSTSSSQSTRVRRTSSSR